ncbi:hypothetical protein PHOSAC3_140112 [Mesotoga infera]|nr:hypothetical protein PHOSAC3_140112 [Mesotoga infera]
MFFAPDQPPTTNHQQLLLAYHYGSYATCWNRNAESGEYDLFPYHYGSYATNTVETYMLFSGEMFPYHYGSYATGSTFFRESLTSLVSIPLWFLRNSPLAFFLLPLFLSFHTTMVLTQPNH